MIKIGSIVKIPVSHFGNTHSDDKRNLTIKVTLIDGLNIEGIVLKTILPSWMKNSIIDFMEMEIVSVKDKKEVVNFD